MPDDAGPPPKGAPAGRAAGRAIRVVDAPRKAKGVLAYSADELARLLHDLVEAGVVLVADDGGRRASADAQAAHTFVQLACAYKRQLTELPLAGGVPLLAIRQALYDTGVIPYGMNASTSVDSPRAQGTPQSSSGPVMVGGLARSPHAKELWQGSPPRKALGFSLPGWAVAAAREDRLDLDSLIVLPARIGRAGTQLGGLALSAQEWNINAGCIPPGLAQLAGPILLAGGAGRAGGRESGQALRALLGHISAFFLKFKPATKAHPKLLEGRLQRGSYTQRHRVLDNEAYAVSTASESEIRELSIALLAVHEFLLSGAAMLVQGMLFPPPSPPEGESDAVSVSGMVVHNKLPVYPPTLFPLFREAADPLSKELKARVAAAEKKYKTVLTYLAGELLRIHGRTAAYRSAKPLNYAAEVFAAEGLSPARDLLIGTEASQERARVQLERLEEEQAARRMQRALEEETEAQAVRARQYLIIIEQKLGGPRLNAVILNLQASRADIDNPQAVLAAVTATTPPRRPRDQGGKTSKGRPKRPAKQSAERGVDAAVVVTEYENLMKQWDLQLANKCPHLDVARNLRAAVVIGEQKKLLARLREFLPTGGKHDHANEWLPCRSCNFRAICPHALRLIELQISRAPFDEVQRVLHPFAREVDLTADPLSSNYAFYCKICGEKLYELFGNEYTIEGIRELGNFDDELKRFLWRSMMHILDPGSNTSRSAQPLVHFDRPVDPARFSAEASDICHPLILAVRTTPRFPAGSEQRALWRELLAVIYLYAYLFGLALGLPPRTGKLKVADVVKVELIPMGNFGSKGRKPASSRNAPAPDELAQILLVHLVKSQSFTISKLESVTNEQIGNQFRDAYRHIQDTHGRLLITQQDSATLLATNLTHLDPYFALLRRGVELSNPTGNISKIQSPEEAGRLFAQVMGRSLGDMLAEKPPPEYGPFARSMLARKSGIELPADVKPEWAFRIPALGLFQKAWGVRAAKQYWDRIMGGSSRTHGGGKRPTRVNKWPNTRQPGSNPPSAKLPKPSLFWDATYLMILYETSVYDDDTFKTYQEILEVARAREREARDPDVHRRLLGRRNYLEETTVPPPLPFDQITEVPLSRLYDENGQPHVWTTFLWSSEVTKPVVDMVQAASVASKVTTALVAGQRAGQQAATPDASPVAKRVASPVAKRVASQPTLQLTAKETGKLLHEAYEAGESTCPLAGYRLIDWVCTTCGARRSQTGDLDERKVRTRLEAREKLQAFYAYYESRCPKEGMHEFGEDVKCKKCGIQSELLTVAGRQTRWDDAFAYYGEHKKAFELITKRNRGGVFVLEDVAAERKLRSAASQGSKPSLERDFNAVLGLAKTLGLGSEIIESMGGTEGFTIEEVQEGKKSDPPTSIDDPRLAAVDGNIRDLLTSYCRFYYGSAGAPRAAPHDLPPPGAVDMEKRYFTPVRAARDAARLADDASAAEWATAILGFGIDAFSWLAAELHGRCKSPETKKAVLELARDIIHREGLFTVAGDFQWSVFGDAEDTRGVSANDAFGDDARRYGEPSSGAEDVLAQKERDYANGVEGSEDRFSFDAVDIDRSTIEANLDN